MLEGLSSDPDLAVTREQEVVPKLSDEKVKKALTVIPVDYWGEVSGRAGGGKIDV